MNKLPPEILKTIFDHLHYSQKLQCKLVCREWAYVLQSGSDIESVAIPFRTDEETGSHVHLPFIENVQHGILKGENCRRLILLNYPDRALLAKLFPNLKLIYFQRQKSPSVELTPERLGQLQNWCKSLETYLDWYSNNETLDILHSGVFQKLTTIKLMENSRSPIELTTIADKLKNAPNLKNLDLIGFEVDMAGLEKLHTNVPCLESLELRCCGVESPGKLPKTIQPAKTIKEFALIECAYRPEFSMTLSEYIVRTYSSLERFSLTFEEVNGDGDYDMQASQIRYTIQMLAPTLRAFHTNAFHWSPNSLRELTNNGPFLEELTADVRGDVSLLTSILELDRITNTLRSLSLHQIPSLQFKLFNRFCHLKQLCLFFEHLKDVSQFFDLDIIMNSFPKSLDTLQLGFLGLDLSPTYVNDIRITHPIKSLTMKHCKLKSDLSGYLSHCFPKLKTLVIIRCETQFHFELPHHHLSFVEFDFYPNDIGTTFKYDQEKDRMPQYQKLFKLTTHHDIFTFYELRTTRRFWAFEEWISKFFDKHDRLQYDINRPSTKHNKESELDYFHFRCASVQTLLLNKELIL